MAESTTKKFKLKSPSLKGAEIVYSFTPSGDICGIYINGEMTTAGRLWVFHSTPKGIEDVERLPLKDKKIEEI